MRETLDYAFGHLRPLEDLQYQKNATNRVAGADVMWRGQVYSRTCRWTNCWAWKPA